jgi:hypothetical protein
MRTTYIETDLKTLIKKLGNKEKIVPQRLDKGKHAEESQTHSPSPCPLKALYLFLYP